jgi:two-component system OmpR family sensor kinase
VLSLVIQDFERLGHTENRIISHVPSGAVMANIDPNAFAILLRNLLENGLKHGDPDKPVEVYLSPKAELRVLSPGPEIPPETLSSLTRPFVRGDTMASGTGLGLAIVKSIAIGSGGAITLRAPMSNGESGLEVVVGLTSERS